ncbi:DNA methyltransferase [Acinetobacter baumannii]
MDTALLKTLKEIFKQFPKFWNGETLQRSLVIDAIQKKEADVIKALINNEKIKTIYSTDIDGVLIFDFDKLISLLKYKEYWADSFTKYRNKVGLTSEGKYLDYSSDVVLDFPFKDCVLEGGMTKEDQGKEEVYYNEVIARDEIDRLFSAKVFTNTKRYTIDGVEENVTQFNDDNLIIKGNNLIALHSLKKVYTGKIKLIYIDPPYNTGNDGFKYNDSFNQSTWLTFMKNRLEVARELLSSDGFIIIQTDDYEQAYLKVLMDEVFGRENFRNSIYWHRTYAGKTVSKNLPWNVDVLHFYSKSEDTKIENVTAELSEKDIASYNKDDNDGRGKYNTVSLQKTGGKGPETTYDYEDNNGKIWKCPEKGWRMKFSKLKALENDGRLYITDKTIREKYYLSERLDIGKQIDNFWSDIGNLNRANDLKFDLTGQKPEKLIKRIIELSTKEKDIVLDYHLGSGTTCATAHKMGRRYIGIEQMDYINEITVPRLKKVIEGEQGGISKDINWQGGGDFVYTELMELNYVFIHKIEQAESTENLIQLFDEMKGQAHLNYQIELEKVLNAEYEVDGVDHFISFGDLELSMQKQLLIELLDKNQLYVSVSEIEDKSLSISESDKAFTTSFYQGGE